MIIVPNGGDHAVYRAVGHLGSQDGAGRSERRLARSIEREAEKSDSEVRFSARPSPSSWSELGLGSRPVIYVRRLCLCNTEVRTRGTSSSAVPSPRPHAASWRCEPMFVLSICRRSVVESAENKGAHRDEHASSLGAQVPALTARATLPMNGHRFRGSHHDTTHIDHAIYARDDRLVIQIRSAAGSASMHK